MLLPAPTQVYNNLRFYVMFFSLGYDDFGNNKYPDNDVPEGAMPIVSVSGQKWYRNKTTESEESEIKIPVGKKLDGRHVLAGEDNNVYAVPLKKKY